MSAERETYDGSYIPSEATTLLSYLGVNRIQIHIVNAADFRGVVMEGLGRTLNVVES